eukprot:GHUV01027190.1.p2 GENE.GHUV01027190.1~~GHUV01027190.1.p2  ORF type:complete len:164 (+),score=46.25 GHUV01027190.1:122-613(+)
MALANLRTSQRTCLQSGRVARSCSRLRSVPVRAQAGSNGASPAAAAPRPAKPAAAPASKQFTNTNKFIVPKHLQQAFLSEWRRREQDMQKHAGFVGFNVINDGENFTISSSWASIPEWEAWSLSPECRRSHLPWGIWQYVPKKGEGFPEDFVPFKHLQCDCGL